MTDADYIAAFQQVLLPVAYEVTHTLIHTFRKFDIDDVMYRSACVFSVSASAGSGLCWIRCRSWRSEGKTPTDLRSVFFFNQMRQLFHSVCVCVCSG